MKLLSIGLLSIVGVALTAWAAGQWRWSAKSQGLLDRLEASRVSAAPEHVDARELDSLPPPVARHLRRVLPEGTGVIRAVDVVHRGTFNMSETGEQWRPFTSHQRVVTRRPGFVWDARIAMMPGLLVHVHDAYVGGEGILEPAILGLYSLMHLQERGDMARGELMRFFAEAAWYPTALLPSQGVRWEPIDDANARGTLVDGALSLTMTFGFGSDGLLASMRVEDRGRTVGGVVVATPWEGRLWNYQRRDGLLVPLEGEVAWLTPTGRLPYWRGTITDIRYQR